jgi:cysteine-rich secretory family protein
VHRWLFLLFGLAWLLPSAAEGQSLDLAAVVERLIGHTQALRQQEGRPPVTPNPQLNAAAQDFATFMANSGQLSHTADGRTPEARARAQGYDPCLIAENLASQYSSAGFTAEALARGFFEGWQQSPEHRANLLDPAVTETGIGAAHSETTGAYYAVQLFGRPKSQQIVFEIANTAQQAIPYTVDGQAMSLPPQSRRTHQHCRPAEITFQWPGTQERQTVHSSHGARYTIVQDDAGKLRLEQG